MSALDERRRPVDGLDPERAAALSRRAGSFCAAARAARAGDGLTAEELVIYLAVGHLGVDTSTRIPRLTPRTYLEIAEFLAIPRETVRRKAARLVDRDLLQLGRGGVVVRDVEAWLTRIVALLGDEDAGNSNAAARVLHRDDTEKKNVENPNMGMNTRLIERNDS